MHFGPEQADVEVAFASFVVEFVVAAERWPEKDARSNESSAASVGPGVVAFGKSAWG
jgi:hypothetical protein